MTQSPPGKRPGIRRGVASSRRHAARSDRRWSLRVVDERKGPPGTCCQSCRHFVRVLMPSRRWWGACASVRSPLADQLVRADHGCVAHEPAPPRDAEQSTLPRHLPCRGVVEEHPLDQCGGCAYWVPLEGRYSLDWGACVCPSGPWDGHVVFEHDGCPAYTPAKGGWPGTRPSAASAPFEPSCVPTARSGTGPSSET